ALSLSPGARHCRSADGPGTLWLPYEVLRAGGLPPFTTAGYILYRFRSLIPYQPVSPAGWLDSPPERVSGGQLMILPAARGLLNPDRNDCAPSTDHFLIKATAAGMCASDPADTD